MKTKNAILILAACGFLALGGAKVYADDAVAAIVAKSLKSDNEADKVKGLDELAGQGAKAAEAVKPIEGLLKDKSAKVRAHALLALGQIGAAAKDSVPAMAASLKDPDENVRRTALLAIRAIHPGPKVMVPILGKLLEDADPAIQGRICNAIAEAGAEAVPGLIEALTNEKAAFWALIILRDIGPAAKEAVPAITEKLKDKRPEIRREAVLTLGAMGSEAAAPAVPQIAALLSGADEHAGTAATFVLGELGQIPKDVEATIRANTKSKDQMLSTASLWALAKVHPEDKQLRKETAEVLVARLKDKDQFVRVGAARALASLPPAPEITAPIWENAMKDADETTVRYAMDALAALGAPAVPRLIDALRFEKFRADVAYALGRIGPPAVAATGELAKLVDDKNSRVAHEAIIALGDIGPGAKDGVHALVKVLNQPDDRDLNFAAIAFALGKIGPDAAESESALLKQLASKDDTLRLLSAWALAKIDPKSADNAAKTVPLLIDGLALPEVQDRLLCAEALGDLGALAKTSMTALKKAATDEDKDVQEVAAKALKAVEKAAAAAAATEPLKPGDFVVTLEDKLEIGVKGSQGQVVPKGTKLKVLEIRGAWVGVRVEGTDKTGWLHAEQLGRQ